MNLERAVTCGITELERIARRIEYTEAQRGMMSSRDRHLYRVLEALLKGHGVHPNLMPDYPHLDRAYIEAFFNQNHVKREDAVNA